MDELSDILAEADKEIKKTERRLPKSQRQPNILLCPNIPKPLHGVNPRTILGRAWWDKERKAAEAGTKGHCLACGIHKTKARFRKWMEGHELYRINYGAGRMTYLKTVPLCHYCHNFIHSGRLQALMEKGEIPVNQFHAIMGHGYGVLHEAGLFDRSPGDKVRG
jgi:hypothetical protein